MPPDPEIQPTRTLPSHSNLRLFRNKKSSKFYVFFHFEPPYFKNGVGESKSDGGSERVGNIMVEYGVSVKLENIIQLKIALEQTIKFMPF